MKETYLIDLLKRLKELLFLHYGEAICSIVIFGSGARGDYTSQSDIDLLLVLEMAENSFGKRVDEFSRVLKRLRASEEYERAKEKGLPYKVQPVILTLEELKRHPPLLLDFITDASILYDKGPFQEEMEKIRLRMEELGSKKVVVDEKRWYWVLKPDIKKGEVVEI